MSNWEYCTSGQAVAKMGSHVSSVSGQAVTMLAWYNEAEGSVAADMHTVISGQRATFETNGTAGAIGDVISSKIAMKGIAHNPNGYLIREADMLMNMNTDIISTGMNTLRDKKFQRLSS